MSVGVTGTVPTTCSARPTVLVATSMVATATMTARQAIHADWTALVYRSKVASTIGSARITSGPASSASMARA